MEAYLLATKRHKKVLLIDFDPQGNLTQMIGSTFGSGAESLLKKATVPLFKGLQNMDLTKSVVKASKNIDIIPTDSLLLMWNQTLKKVPDDLQPWILNHLLKPFRGKYDYIMIDVPPTSNQFVLNAIFACDAISLVVQTQEMSYNSALFSAKLLMQLRKKYHLNFRFLGVILYLVKKKAKIDKQISNKAKKAFNGAVYFNSIHTQERVKGFGANGIKDNDHWDKRAIKMYENVVNELLYRIKEMFTND